MYTVYHLPELEKVGCTNRFEARMKEQGFDPNSVQILVKTSSIEEASMAEEIMRKFYNYKEDSNMTYAEKFGNVSWSNSIKKVWRDSHFVGYNELPKGASKDDLKASLEVFDIIVLETKGGEFKFTRDDIPALVKAAKVSQHRDFYWNTKLLQNIANESTEGGRSNNNDDNKSFGGRRDNGITIPEFEQIREWATVRGLYEKGDPKTQMVKLVEEVGETAKAILKDDQDEILDGLGDILVVLINLSHLSGYKLEECLALAYREIKNRKGSMKGGTFVKQETL